MSLKETTQETDIQIGKRICSLRKIRGMSQTALAEKLGITFQQVQKYENGMNRVSVSALVVICKALSISPMDILGIYFGQDDGQSPAMMAAEVDRLKNLISVAVGELQAA